MSAEFSTSSTDLFQNNKRTNVRNTFTVHTSGQLLLTQRVSWSCNLFFNRPNRNTFQVQPCTQSALWKGVLQVYNQSVLTCLLWLILDLISRRMILWLQALTLSITINIFQTTLSSTTCPPKALLFQAEESQPTWLITVLREAVTDLYIFPILFHPFGDWDQDWMLYAAWLQSMDCSEKHSKYPLFYLCSFPFNYNLLICSFSYHALSCGTPKTCLYHVHQSLPFKR